MHLHAIRLFVCAAFWSSAAFSQEALAPTDVPTGVTATLYADGPFVEVLEVAGSGPWLYAAVRDLDGGQRLDVWRVAPPAPPEIVDTITYPSLQENAFVFTPLALYARDGVLLVQAEGVLRSYRHSMDGSLALVEEQTLVTGLGANIMSGLSFGGAFASHEQQVVPSNQIGTVPLEKINQQVILSLRDPARPFLVRGGSDISAFMNTDDPVNATWRGEPASLSFDSNTNEGSLTTFDRTLEAHLDTFWAAKLDALFAEGALELSLEAHLRAVLQSLDMPALRGGLLAEYQAALDVDETTVEGLILARHLGTEDLAGVLATHGLSLDEPLALSLRKIATESLNEALRTNLARILYEPVVEAWLSQTLGIAWDGLSAAELAGDIALAFDEELNTDGAVRYLTLNVVAPMLDDPDFMTWTLDELIDEIVASEVGAAIDVTLTVTGVGLIGEVLAAIDALPGVDLPNCALFPGDARGLIDLALYSGGADLDAQGLAWFEMLKLYQYLTGGLDFAAYTAEVDGALRELHLELAHEFAGSYLGFFSGFEGFASSDALLADIAEQAAVDQVLGDLLARAALQRIEAAGFDTDVTLLTFLQVLNLPFEFGGELTADIDGLVAALDTAGLRVETAGDLFLRAETVPFDLGGRLAAFLNARLEALFGYATPDLTLRAALHGYLREQLDLGTAFSVEFESLLDTLAVEVHGAVPFANYVTNALNAFDGDCIAQWLIALDAATLVATPLSLEAFPIAAEAALNTAYHTALNVAIDSMFGLVAESVIGDLSGHWQSWTEQVTPVSYPFSVPEEDNGFDVTVRGTFLWEDRVVLVLSYRSQAEPFALRPVYLQTFEPGDPAGTREVVDLGPWEQVDFAQQAGKDLFLSGRHPVGEATAYGLLIDLDRQDGRHFVGEDFLPLGVTEQMASLGNGELLALRGEGRVTLIPNAGVNPLPDVIHSADTDGNRRIDLSEVLRLIQLFHFPHFGCADSAVEDGFEPLSLARDCSPHAADYAPQDWRVDLAELLRIIQIFNQRGYTNCIDTEDGFCAQR